MILRIYHSKVKMKILYIHKILGEEVGVLNKIRFQINAFKNLNNEVVEFFFKNVEKKDKAEVIFDNSIIGEIPLKKSIIYILKRKIIENLIFIKMMNEKKYIDIDMIYVRHFSLSFISVLYFRFLKKKKKRIVIEIPTYPYNKEKSGIQLKYDLICWKFVKRYIDRIITFSEDKIIFDIPCINISNGIDLEEIKILEKEVKNNDEISFISVSNCSYWHGIDRFLKSLDMHLNIYKQYKIKFYIIGNGEQIPNLKEIVNKSQNLKGIVFFEGIKKGEDLAKYYNKADIGVGSLARHRSGLYIMKALKNREYCAKGLPMIFSEDDPDLRKVSFVYNVSADEELIDINKIIEWYRNLDLSSKEIREYSKKFSWDIQLDKVIYEIKKI